MVYQVLESYYFSVMYLDNEAFFYVIFGHSPE